MLFMVYPQMIPGKAPPPQITGQVGGASSGSMHGQAGANPTGSNVQSQQPSPLGPGFPRSGAGGDSTVQNPAATTSSSNAAPHAQIGGGTLSTAGAAMKAEMYDPKLFGFRVNEMAKLKRWREAQRDR